MTPFQILVLLMLAYICYRLTVLGSTSFLKSLATYLIFGLENGLRHEIPFPPSSAANARQIPKHPRPVSHRKSRTEIAAEYGPDSPRNIAKPARHVRAQTMSTE